MLTRITALSEPDTMATSSISPVDYGAIGYASELNIALQCTMEKHSGGQQFGRCSINPMVGSAEDPIVSLPVIMAFSWRTWLIGKSLITRGKGFMKRSIVWWNPPAATTDPCSGGSLAAGLRRVSSITRSFPTSWKWPVDGFRPINGQSQPGSPCGVFYTRIGNSSRNPSTEGHHPLCVVKLKRSGILQFAPITSFIITHRRKRVITKMDMPCIIRHYADIEHDAPCYQQTGRYIYRVCHRSAL